MDEEAFEDVGTEERGPRGWPETFTSVFEASSQL